MTAVAGYDAIVIGAGHNGLTAAAYLGRAGLRTLVLERRGIVGGCCVTAEIDARAAPGCRVSTCAYIASMLRPEVIRDLELARHGLRMVPLEPAVQAAFPDGDLVAWWNRRDRLDAELNRIAPGEAPAFHRALDGLKRLARYLQPFFLEAPPDTQAKGLRLLTEKYRLWKRLRSMSGHDITAMTELLAGSLGDYLDRRFQSEKLKRLILANSLYGKHGGPYQPGTAVGLLFHLLSGGEEQQQGWAGHVLGGMGSITQAMAGACRGFGVDIRTGAPVAEVEVGNGSARGVVLEDGSRYAARVVLSNADPKRTFLKLVAPGHLDDAFRRQVAAIKMAGPCAKVNLVLGEEPKLMGMPVGAAPLRRSIFTLVPTLEQAERCYAVAASGEIPEDLWLDCVVPTLVDPGLCPAGKHVLSCFVQYLPYRPRQGSWPERREHLQRQVLEKIGNYAPNVPGSVIAAQVITPLDLEVTFGITEGNIFHGDPNLEQLFFMRPVPGWSQYATPINGLYLCGAGAHPGGGVTGAPGYNAARKVLRDLKRLKRTLH